MIGNRTRSLTFGREIVSTRIESSEGRAVIAAGHVKRRCHDNCQQRGGCPGGLEPSVPVRTLLGGLAGAQTNRAVVQRYARPAATERCQSCCPRELADGRSRVQDKLSDTHVVPWQRMVLGRRGGTGRVHQPSPDGKPSVPQRRAVVPRQRAALLLTRSTS